MIFISKFLCPKLEREVGMRYRNIKKQFWFSEEENKILATNSEKAGLSESEYIRELLIGYKLKEKPDDRFYESLKVIRGLANNMNQLATKTHSLGFIDELSYQKNADKVFLFIEQFKDEYLRESLEEQK